MQYNHQREFKEWLKKKEKEEKLLDEIEDVTVYYVLKKSDRRLLEILILLM